MIEFIPLLWVELSYRALCRGERLVVYSRPIKHRADRRQTEENKRIERMLRSALLPTDPPPTPDHFISLEV